MSQTDSFIQEVTDEVRRDRMTRLARRYGWIPLLVVVLAVAGTAFFEWRQSQSTAQAQAVGDRIYAALDAESGLASATALAEIDATSEGAAIVAMLRAAELSAEQPAEAMDLLEGVAANGDLPQIYRDAATLKMVTMPGSPLIAEERLQYLEPLTEPGAPLRLAALEQMALVHLANGAQEEALARLREVADAAGASAAQRQRVQQLIVVLGGDTEGA